LGFYSTPLSQQLLSRRISLQQKGAGRDIKITWGRWDIFVIVHRCKKNGIHGRDYFLPIHCSNTGKGTLCV